MSVNTITKGFITLAHGGKHKHKCCGNLLQCFLILEKVGLKLSWQINAVFFITLAPGAYIQTLKLRIIYQLF